MGETCTKLPKKSPHYIISGLEDEKNMIGRTSVVPTGRTRQYQELLSPASIWQ